MGTIQRFYLGGHNDATEQCVYVQAEGELSKRDGEVLRWLIAPQHMPSLLTDTTRLDSSGPLLEAGPRRSFQTSYSTNRVSVLRRCGVPVSRVEVSRRILIPGDVDREMFASGFYDSLTEELYPGPLTTFVTGAAPEAVFTIPVLEEGVEALRRVNEKCAWGMDPDDMPHYVALFEKESRNPTNVECQQLANVNSDHCRHKTWGASWVIDGTLQKLTLMELAKRPMEVLGAGVSRIAFHDNCSAIEGARIRVLMPEHPGHCSRMLLCTVTWHVGCTCETHNHPAMIEPLEGAATGAGGEIRDLQMLGRGGMPVYLIGGYSVGSLELPGVAIPGQYTGGTYPSDIALPTSILVRASDGFTAYGNRLGIPTVQGYVRTGEIMTPSGDWYGDLKPTVFAGGTTMVDDHHLAKKEPQIGDLIVVVGGPVYPIGVGGGAMSSVMGGQSSAAANLASVQRGDPEMENKMNRVVRACCLMGSNTPIRLAHDSGAGGNSNALSEAIAPVGGTIHIRRVVLGDKDMPVVYIWVAEAQERNALIIDPDRIDEFREVCRGENVNCEVLGQIDGSGRVVVVDEEEGTTPVNLSLRDMLGNLPQRTFESTTPDFGLQPFSAPEDESMANLVERVFRIPDVGSKQWLTSKGDQNVGGNMVQHQDCGPLGLPVSDVAVASQSMLDYAGLATGLGEQPWKILVNPRAGMRMAVAEALMNLVGAVVTGRQDVRVSINWMVAAKLPGEGAMLYRASEAASKFLIELGISQDSGKDSSSKAVKVGDIWAKGPCTGVVTAYGAVPDIRHVVNPAIRIPGGSSLVFVDIACGRSRLGGSMLAKSYGVLGDESPDVDDPLMFGNVWDVLQELIRNGVVLALHDRSDGGLITTVSEMLMAGNCGANLQLNGAHAPNATWFAEELGWVLECRIEDEAQVQEAFAKLDRKPDLHVLGRTTEERKVTISHNGITVLNEDTHTLLAWWEAVSNAIERLQTDGTIVDEQAKNCARTGPALHLTYEPTIPEVCENSRIPMAILREEGSNGDAEMSAYFFEAGFDVHDVRMSDLQEGRFTLDGVRGLAAVGGFSFSDVFGAAKGWAASILFNRDLLEMFTRFRERQDTFGLGVCNGYQLFTYLDWLLWKGIPEVTQPRLVANTSGRFTTSTVAVRIGESSSIFTDGMVGSILPITVAHGEGMHLFPDTAIMDEAFDRKLVPMQYVNDQGDPTEEAPFNPNGSPFGIASMCSQDGRFTGMMPHPERSFRIEQMEYVPQAWKQYRVGPCMRIAENAMRWCMRNP